MKKLFVIILLAACSLYGGIDWHDRKSIPAGVRENFEGVVKSAKLEDFEITAGMMDSPVIKEAFSKNFPGRELKDDGFFLCINGRKIVLGSRVPRGLVYGISHAAEKLSGYLPARPLGQDRPVPGTAKTDLKYSVCTNPEFKFRRMGVVSFNNIHIDFTRWMLRNGFNCAWDPVSKTATNYPHATDLGLAWHPVGGHTFYYWLPGDLYAAHPEYFPLVDGKRKKYPKKGYATHVQLEFGSPAVQDLVAKRIVEYADKYPSCTSVGFGMNDGGGWGDSPESRAMDDPEEYKQGNYSTRYFRFANIVAEKVAEKKPELKIGALAYLRCVAPPKLEKLHPNISVTICTYRRCYKCRINDPNCTVNRYWNKILTGWARFGNPIYIYDYLRINAAFPIPYMRVIQKDLQYYRKLGVCSYHTEMIVDGGKANLAIDNPRLKGFYRSKPEENEEYWTGSKMNLWLLGKLLWDPNAGLDGLIDEYYGKYFGPAGCHLRKIFGLIEKRWQEYEAPFMWTDARVNFPEMLFREGDEKYMEACLKAAETAAANQPYYAARVAKEAGLIRGTWFRLMGAKSKELPLRNGKKSVIGFVKSSRKGPVPPTDKSRLAVSLQGDTLVLDGEFFQKKDTIDARNPGRDIHGKGYGDTFEIFIQAGPEKRRDGHYQLIVSAGGGMWDYQMRNSEWNCSFTAETKILPDKWTAHVVIPLKELGYPAVKKGQRIKANFCRVRIRPREISSWTNGSLAGSSYFGTLVAE